MHDNVPELGDLHTDVCTAMRKNFKDSERFKVYNAAIYKGLRGLTCVAKTSVPSKSRIISVLIGTMQAYPEMRLQMTVIPVQAFLRLCK